MGVQVNQKDGNRRNNNRGQQGGRLGSQGSHENRVSSKHVSNACDSQAHAFVMSFVQNQRNNQNRQGQGNWVRNNNQNARNNQRPQRRPGVPVRTINTIALQIQCLHILPFFYS